MTEKATSDREVRRLGEILDSLPSEDAMNLEELDGFLAALGCAPDEVPPQDYLPELFGTVEEDVELFPDVESLREFLKLVLRRYASVMLRLTRGDEFVPMLQENDDGAVTGNDWARGFVRGMHISGESWQDLLEDEEYAGLLVPIFALAYEHDPDPETRPFDEPVDEEQRELLLAGMSAAAPLICEYFSPAADDDGDEDDGDAEEFWPVAPYQREGPKVGRNEPCPCGPGKKYKRCCGANA